MSAGATGSASSATCHGVDLSSDPSNCGACGHGCLGGACAAGLCQPVVVADGQAYASALAIDADARYWGAENAQQLVTMPLAGGSPTVLASTTTNGLTLDDENLYWTDFVNGNVLSMPKSGGTPTTRVGQSDVALYWTSPPTNTV